MHFMRITFCTDAFAHLGHLTAEGRADLIVSMIESGTLDMRSGTFDVVDSTESIAAMVEAAEVDTLSEA